MNWFADWFGSRAGVWQTLLAVLVVIGFEKAFPRSDPHGFLLLYWLTVYSAVTQPVLAYSSLQGGTSARRTEERILKLERRMNHKLDRIAEALGVSFDE